MAAPILAYTNSPAQPSIRTPNLKYRTSTRESESSNATRIDAAADTITSTHLVSSAPSEYSTSIGYSSSDHHISVSSRPPSIAPSSLRPIRDVQTLERKTNKKQGFFSSLFSVKEPSAQALIDYERQLAKQGSLKNGRIGAAGMPGVSSTRLPEKVPKVNSKWDGVPGSIEREKRARDSSRPSMMMTKRNSASGISTVSSGADSLRTSESRGPQSRGTISGASIKTAHSGGSTNKLAELYGWEFSKSTGEEAMGNSSMERSRPSTSRAGSGGSYPRSPASEPATDSSEPPKIPTSYFEQALPSPPPLSHSPCVTPLDLSPATPDRGSPLLNPTTPDSGDTLCEPHKGRSDRLRTTTLEAPLNLDAVIIRSSGVDILGPPVSARRKQKLPSSGPSSDGRPKTSESLHPLKPILKKENRLQEAHDARDTSVSPGSRLSDSRHRRLSMQGKGGIDHQSTESPPSGSEDTSYRIVTPTPESGRQSVGRKGRLSMFKRSPHE